MNYKFEIRGLISTIHSLVHHLISMGWETNLTAAQRDSINTLRKAASDCFDELYKDIKK